VAQRVRVSRSRPDVASAERQASFHAPVADRLALAGDEQRDAFAGPVRACILKVLRQAINDDRTDRSRPD